MHKEEKAIKRYWTEKTIKEFVNLINENHKHLHIDELTCIIFATLVQFYNKYGDNGDRLKIFLDMAMKKVKDE